MTNLLLAFPITSSH